MMNKTSQQLKRGLSFYKRNHKTKKEKANFKIIRRLISMQENTE